MGKLGNQGNRGQGIRMQGIMKEQDLQVDE
jgi:hypothetical protein